MICRQWNEEVKGNKKKPEEMNRFQIRTKGKKKHTKWKAMQEKSKFMENDGKRKKSTATKENDRKWNEMNWKDMKRNRRKCMELNGHERKSKEMKEHWTKRKEMKRKQKETWVYGYRNTLYGYAQARARNRPQRSLPHIYIYINILIYINI